MKDRLFIATQVAAGFISGIPVSSTDLETLLEGPSTLQETRKTLQAVSTLSLMMADALIEAERCSEPADSKIAALQGTK